MWTGRSVVSELLAPVVFVVESSAPWVPDVAFVVEADWATVPLTIADEDIVTGSTRGIIVAWNELKLDKLKKPRGFNRDCRCSGSSGLYLYSR